MLTDEDAADFTVRRKLVSIGRDYNIEDKNGNVVFRVDGKVRFARTFTITDRERNVLLSIREKLLSIDALFVIKRDDRNIALVRRRSYRDQANVRFEIELHGGITMKASGSFFDTGGIRIMRGEAIAGVVKKKEYTAISEIYFVNTDPGEDQSLLLGIAMCIVEMSPARDEDHN